MRKLTLNEQSALNIVGSIVVVAINVAINFLLSPFIVEHLGVEANGYITLANNFISYIALIIIALNSMCGRFIMINYRHGNKQEVNEYYSSVMIGDWILSAIFLIPMILFVTFIDKIINVSGNNIADTRILFAVVFLNYVLSICLPPWQTATYCTNNLYLRSLRNVITATIRAVAIYLLFVFLPPHSYYVAIAATLMTIVSFLLDYIFYKRLMPELRFSIYSFNIKKVRELISSGIWNTVSQCGNLLLEGLDVLIANIFINPVVSGVLALSKVIPNMINQITGTVATTYGPRLTYLYADGKMKEMANEIKNDIIVVSILSNIPIGLFFVYGLDFFALWVPSQDACQLAILSSMSLIGLLFAGIAQCFGNVFGVVNKLKLNSFVVIGTGLVNLLGVFLLLKFTNLGVYSIVAVSSTVTILRVFFFTAPYAAYLIQASALRFYFYLLKGASFAIIPIVLGLGFKYLLNPNTWVDLILAIAITAIVSLIINFYVLLNKTQKEAILHLLHLKKS